MGGMGEKKDKGKGREGEGGRKGRGKGESGGREGGKEIISAPSNKNLPLHH